MSISKGHMHTHGLDFHEKFATVAKLNQVKRVLSDCESGLASSPAQCKKYIPRWWSSQEVCMLVPVGFPLESDTICWLKKAIYGLKQPLKDWF